MKLFGRELKLPTFAKMRDFALSSPEAVAFLTVQDMVNDARGVLPRDAFQNYVWCFRCIHSISKNIAMLPFEIWKNEQAVENHPVLQLLKKPNEFMSEFELLYTTIAHLNIWGESFWLLGHAELNPGGRLLLIAPNRIKEEIKDGELVGWRIAMPGGKGAVVDPSDVAQFKFPHPFNEYRGMAPLGAANLAISSDLAAARFNLGFFSRGAVPKGILWTEQKLPKLTADEIIDDFERKHRLGNKPAFLHSGLKYQETQMSNHDMEFQKLREMNREEILAAFGVPPVEVGLLQYASYANAQEQTKRYWNGTLLPIADLIADVISKKLVRDESLECVFNTDKVEDLRDTLKEKSGTATSLFGLGLPLNAIIKALDLPFDPVPWGDVGYLPFGLRPVGGSDISGIMGNVGSTKNKLALLKQGKNPKAIAGDVQAPDAMPTHDKLDGLKRPSHKLNKLKPAATTQDKLDALSTGKFFDDLQTRVSGVMVRALDPDTIDEIVEIIMEDKTVLAQLSRDYYQRAIEFGVKQITDLMNLEFDLSNPLVVDFIESKVIEITQISETTAERIRTILETAYQDGDSIESIGRELRDDFNFGPDRARMIARTEIGSSVNAGRYAVMQNEGVTQHEWISARDERVRESHQEEDGSVVDLGDEFPVTGLQYPGDPDGEPSEVINCRCITLPVTDERSIFNADERADYWKRAFESGWQKIEEDFASALSKFFYKQRRRVLKKLKA